MRTVRALLNSVVAVRPTARGTGLLVAAAICFVGAPILALPALLSVTGLLLALVVLAALAVGLTRPRVSVVRAVEPRDLAVGEPGTVTVEIVNRSSWPTPAGRWRDRLPRALSARPRGDLPALGGRDTAEATAILRYQVRAGRRGEHHLGPLTVDVTDPFGVVRRRVALGSVDSTVVLPRWTDLRSGRSRPDALQHEAQRARLVGAGEDDVVARAYRAGDALKRVHWKATAHRGELMVRQEEQEGGTATLLVLDADAASHGIGGPDDDSDQLEWAVSATASIAALLDHRGVPVIATVTGAETTSPTRRSGGGQGTREPLLRDLAVVRAGHGAPVLPGEAGGQAVVVLGQPDVARANAWRDLLRDRRDVRAFVARWTSAQARAVLTDAGWHVVDYSESEDLAERWGHLEAGRRHAAT